MVFPASRTLSWHCANGVPYCTFSLLDEAPIIRHGFSTRLGGVSTGIYQSMNLSFTRGDNPDAVRENFRLFCRAVGVDERDVVLSAQTHHTTIYRVGAGDRGKGVIYPSGWTDVDGLMTDEKHVVLCALFADCVPLFFADPVRGCVAVSHAGWKGTVAGIAAKTVRAMCTAYGSRPSDLLVGIGPSIGPCCFEVDFPVARQFSELPFSDTTAVRETENGKAMVDLWEINRRFLLSSGVRDDHIAVTDLCTCCHPDIFWSHRATGGKRGNLAALISLV